MTSIAALAAASDWPAVAALLELAERGGPDAPDLDARDEGGWTAMMHCADSGKVDLLRRLVRAGANVEAADRSGATALMKAAHNGRVDLLEVLVEEGHAELDQCAANNGTTALLIACRAGNESAATFLVGVGADKAGVRAVLANAPEPIPWAAELLG